MWPPALCSSITVSSSHIWKTNVLHVIVATSKHRFDSIFLLLSTLVIFLAVHRLTMARGANPTVGLLFVRYNLIQVSVAKRYKFLILTVSVVRLTAKGLMCYRARCCEHNSEVREAVHSFNLLCLVPNLPFWAPSCSAKRHPICLFGVHFHAELFAFFLECPVIPIGSSPSLPNRRRSQCEFICFRNFLQNRVDIHDDSSRLPLASIKHRECPTCVGLPWNILPCVSLTDLSAHCRKL